MKPNRNARFWALVMIFCFLFLFGSMARAGGADPEQRENLSLGLLFTYPIRFFQKVISPADGDRCGMYPSCSTYATESFKKNGPVMGWIMTADRLIRCGHDEKGLGPPVRANGYLLTHDPVGNNDFWWKKNK